MRQPRQTCIRCTYPLQGLEATPNCPECGYSIERSMAEIPPLLVRQRKAMLSVVVPSAIALTCLSLCIVWLNASEEPYRGLIRASQLLVQVGLSSIVFFLWMAWALVIFVAVCQGRLRAFWLAALVWAGIVMFFLGSSIQGYIGDVTTFSREVSNGHVIWAPSKP